ncbi:hypothetical protein IE81DRAFT_254932 [Ceraceosorus guamensis]|uniref:Uncharacterized protein n=1 Tax=Ceraceosorus guamensis TaxID=1522189 RepID=A0A316W4V5_9BASI|nr:hypothetical protein IE81DRAFT_254932 [Ceraceosorus guamensis]PWN44799.1 hypothetical protein IE81DRAFT_254932 [Ceraceosorus guamensis]
MTPATPDTLEEESPVDISARRSSDAMKRAPSGHATHSAALPTRPFHFLLGLTLSYSSFVMNGLLARIHRSNWSGERGVVLKDAVRLLAELYDGLGGEGVAGRISGDFTPLVLASVCIGALPLSNRVMLGGGCDIAAAARDIVKRTLASVAVSDSRTLVRSAPLPVFLPGSVFGSAALVKTKAGFFCTVDAAPLEAAPADLEDPPAVKTNSDAGIVFCTHLDCPGLLVNLAGLRWVDFRFAACCSIPLNSAACSLTPPSGLEGGLFIGELGAVTKPSSGLGTRLMRLVLESLPDPGKGMIGEWSARSKSRRAKQPTTHSARIAESWSGIRVPFFAPQRHRD